MAKFKWNSPQVSLMLGCFIALVSLINVYKYSQKSDGFGAVCSAVSTLAGGALIALATVRLKGRG